MVGYTPSLSTAVWMGSEGREPIINVNGGIIYGSGLPGAIWQRYMSAVLAGTPPQDLPDAPVIKGDTGEGVPAPVTTTAPPPVVTQPTRPRPTAPPTTQPTDTAPPEPTDTTSAEPTDTATATVTGPGLPAPGTSDARGGGGTAGRSP
jgi:membrane peptidoglycan carboxypeptidase